MSQDDTPSMGCAVPYQPCLDCKPCDHTELASDIRFTDISLITFTDDHIRRIAEHAGVSEERIRAYLGDQAEQDDDLFRAVHWVTGCCPIGKFPRREVNIP